MAATVSVPSTGPLKRHLYPSPLSSSSSLFSLFLTKPHKPRKLPPICMSMEARIGIMGTKLGMMTYFEPTRIVVPVTVVGFQEGNIVTQVNTWATDGYNAVQVGYRRVRDRKLTKPEMGHLEKSGVIPLRHLQEFRLESVDGFEPNQRLVLEEVFKEGDLVDVGVARIKNKIRENRFKWVGHTNAVVKRSDMIVSNDNIRGRVRPNVTLDAVVKNEHIALERTHNNVMIGT